MSKHKRDPRPKARRRKSRGFAITSNTTAFLELWTWLLPSGIFAKIVRHGDTKWLPFHFVIRNGR